MISTLNEKVYIYKGNEVIDAHSDVQADEFAASHGVQSGNYAQNTIAYSILSSHNTSGDDKKLRLRFNLSMKEPRGRASVRVLLVAINR